MLYMAKAKQKKRIAKTKRRAAKPARRAATAVNPVVLSSARILIIAAGIITMIAGLVYTYSGYVVNGLTLETWFALANLVLGILMLLMLTTLNRRPRAAAVWMILFGIITLMLVPYGFIVGPVFALIAGILVLVKFSVY